MARGKSLDLCELRFRNNSLKYMNKGVSRVGEKGVDSKELKINSSSEKLKDRIKENF